MDEQIVTLPEIDDKALPTNDTKGGFESAIQPNIVDTDHSYVLRKGDTMTGRLVLAGETGVDPTWDSSSLVLNASVAQNFSDTAYIVLAPDIAPSFVVGTVTGIVLDYPTGDTDGIGNYIGIYSDLRGDSVATNHTGLYILVEGDEYAAKFVGKVNLEQKTGSTNNGDIWQDSEQQAFQVYVDNIEQSLAGVIYTQIASKTVSNTGTETTLLNTAVGTATLPADFFTAGKTIRITARGIYGSDTITPGNLNIRVKLGSTTILSTGNTAVTAALTNKYWEINADITCRTTGVSGTVQGHGDFLHDDALAGKPLSIWSMVNTGTTALDTTASQAIDITADYDAADADNTITCQIVTIKVLN